MKKNSITFVDSIMGSGKTTWAIDYMNSHPQEHFVYITPFLNECTRIIENCPSLHFTEPNDKPFGKRADLRDLLKQGKNIAMTHELLKIFALKDSDREHIEKYGYTFIIDEALETILPVESISKAEVRGIFRNGWAKVEENGKVIWMENKEEFIQNKKIKREAECGNLFWYRDSLLLWLLPVELIKAMPRLYVLTFMSEASHLRHYLEIHHLPYTVSHVEARTIRDGSIDLKETKDRLNSLINIYHGPLNDIGEGNGALSATYYRKNKNSSEVENNARSFLRHENARSDEVMWSSFVSNRLSINGYDKGFVPFNSRATNKYRDRKYLAYLVSVYENPMVSGWFEEHGSPLDSSQFALATMLQWIYRSRIRDGQPIDLYLPSSRMRTILTDWLNSENQIR